MSKRLLFLALLTASGFLTASALANDQSPKSFHGVTVLASNIEIRSSSSGLSTTYKGTIGPYAEDAVVLISSRGELNYPGAWRQDRMRVALDVSGEKLLSRWAMASTVGGSEGGPLTYSMGGDKPVFIPKGQVRTLDMIAENAGDFDPKQAITIASAHLTVLAAGS